MRDALNFNMLPIIQEDMSASFNTGVRNFISSNGYYGYQPPVQGKHSEVETKLPVEDNVTMCMDFQFNDNNTEKQTMEIYDYSIPRYVNRKRSWDLSYEMPVFKKRRQDEPLPTILEQPASQTQPINFRQPTHNMPDMPRCLMGHYI